MQPKSKSAGTLFFACAAFFRTIFRQVVILRELSPIWSDLNIWSAVDGGKTAKESLLELEAVSGLS
jgi:hypothetical protein